MELADEFQMSEYARVICATAGAITLGAVAGTALLDMATRPAPVTPPLDLNNQSVEVPGVPGARMSRLCRDGELMEYAFEDAKTFYEAFQRGKRVSNNGPCLGWRPAPKTPYEWNTYGEVIQRAQHAGSGFIKKGMSATNNTRIGIYSQNKVEYIVTELACYTYSMVIVPLYDTLGPEACTFIINQAKIELVVCDKNSRVNALLDHIKSTPRLRVIVCIETPSEDNITKADDLGIQLMSYSEIESLGEENLIPPKPCSQDDLSTVCYTSGTTGTPKGAMITHRNLMSVVAGIHMNLESLKVRPDDIMISYLPLAHMYERVCECTMYMNGSRVGFYQGDVRQLMDDIAVLRPTIFPTVPRLLNRMYDKVMAAVASSRVKSMLMTLALAAKGREVKNQILRSNSIWDKLVFRKVRASLGGRCRLITTGSAPISPRVLNFTRAATGCVVLEGYGQTEGAAVCTLQVEGEAGTGQVGCPLTCTMIKVVDVPEMDYFARDQKGEVCIKGPNVFLGYLDQLDKTMEAVDQEGWLHTGDIGEWLPNGALKIIDRKKHIFKLAQGEYIAPEKIENILIRCPAISQMFVHGDSLQACLVGVAVPDPDVFPGWVKEKVGAEVTNGKSIPELCRIPAVKAAVLADLQAIGKSGGLHSFEQVKDIVLHTEQFTIENGLLTPTFKSRRNDILRQFQRQFDDMYKSLQ